MAEPALAAQVPAREHRCNPLLLMKQIDAAKPCAEIAMLIKSPFQKATAALSFYQCYGAIIREGEGESFKIPKLDTLGQTSPFKSETKK
jgi:hypothetical protein